MAFGDQDQDQDTNKNMDDQSTDKNVDDKSAQKHDDGDKNRVFMIVGDRAFRTQDDVANKITNADEHIQTLEAERAADREKLQAAEAELERLRKLEAGLDGRQNAGNTDQTDQLSKEDIVKSVVVALESKKSAEVKKSNADSSEAMAKEAYGDEWNKKVISLAAEEGMSIEQLNALAEDNPKLFRKLFIPADAGKPNVPTTPNTLFNETQRQQTKEPAPVNITKLRKEKDRIALVSQKMKDAGVPGY